MDVASYIKDGQLKFTLFDHTLICNDSSGLNAEEDFKNEFFNALSLTHEIFNQENSHALFIDDLIILEALAPNIKLGRDFLNEILDKFSTSKVLEIPLFIISISI